MKNTNWYREIMGSLAALVFLTACPSPPFDPIPQRPTEVWVRRSVLDLKPRMLSLALHKKGWVAYDTETCLPEKVWEGGIHWDGAAYTNVKTIQPASWGNLYWQAQPDSQYWYWESQGQRHRARAQFKGYQLQDNRIWLQYVIPAGEHSLHIRERPEFYVANEEAVFEQVFEVPEMPPGIHLYQGEQLLSAQTTITHHFPLFDSLVYQARIVSANNSQNWLDRSGCNTCHAYDQATIGPSYSQIAARYPATEANLLYLIQKVQEGGAGKWGDVPMIPHPQLEPYDIRRMIHYILSLGPDPIPPIRRKKKAYVQTPTASPGFGAALTEVHPAFELQAIRPAHFQPRVGGMDFLPDGRLLVSTWDSIGAVYALDHLDAGHPDSVQVRRIAAGLHEPLGLKVVGEEIFVIQKQELTQLIDQNGDGLIDTYVSICNGFGATADFHEFSYGLAYREPYFYANLGLAMRLMSTELQHPDRGSTIRISRDGQFEPIMTGLRQANGISPGPGGEILISENQGNWVPASKLIVVQEGAFHGCLSQSGDRYAGLRAARPAVWLPQDEIANSPGQPLHIPSGLYQDQVLLADVTHGGLKRIFLEQVNDQWQGAVFRFSQGLEAGSNRMVWGPDGALYVGGVGMNGNWGWQGKQYGLQRLVPTGEVAFELLAVKATATGLDLVFTEPLGEAGIQASDILVQQWRYEATAAYGGPKLDLKELTIKNLRLSSDRRTVHLSLPGRKKQHVIYLRLAKDLQSQKEKKLWSGEAWYTLNEF